MTRLVMRIVLGIALLSSTALGSVHAEDRSVLIACKELIARTQTHADRAEEAELTRCRQVVREWALRDARMTVDEQGRPLK